MSDRQSANRDDLALLEEAARAAGTLAAELCARGVKSWKKDDNSPVSEADIAVNELVADKLRSARPGYGWISEEDQESHNRQYPDGPCFVIDPIDGTLDFLNGGKIWTISLAIVEDGQPVCGVVICPTGGNLYSASAHGTAMHNGAPISSGADAQARQAPPATALRVSAPGLLDAHHADMRDLGMEMTENIASIAHRLVRLALGEFDIALSKAQMCHWDVAAADLILRRTGYQLRRLGQDRGTIEYHGCTSDYTGPLIAGLPAILDSRQPVLRKAFGVPLGAKADGNDDRKGAAAAPAPPGSASRASA